MSSIDPRALSQLDEASRKEMAQWVETEMSQAKLRSSIHGFTDLCFKKCVTSVSGGTLSSQEDSCLKNCLDRFLDTNVAIVKMIQKQ